jgi:hypothetical protein
MSLKDDDTDEDGNDERCAPDSFVNAQPGNIGDRIRVEAVLEARDGFYNTPLTPDTLRYMEERSNECLRLVAAWRAFDSKPS